MLVSIVIDNYNYDRFVCAAIDSALSQSYQPVEVIVVDDGSTDQSRDLINRFGDQISTILQDNGGQASALNAGFARSQGEIVIFLDADDILLPHAVQTAVDAFTAQPDIARLQ
jgi:glycosyltransferase involved in cell wall biosynthesis